MTLWARGGWGRVAQQLDGCPVEWAERCVDEVGC